MNLNFSKESRPNRPIFFNNDNGIELKIFDDNELVISELLVEVNRCKILANNFEYIIENISKENNLPKYRIRNSTKQTDLGQITIFPNEHILFGAVLSSYNADILLDEKCYSFRNLTSPNFLNFFHLRKNRKYVFGIESKDDAVIYEFILKIPFIQTPSILRQSKAVGIINTLLTDKILISIGLVLAQLYFEDNYQKTKNFNF
jgi:hypothetical protein